MAGRRVIRVEADLARIRAPTYMAALPLPPPGSHHVIDDATEVDLARAGDERVDEAPRARGRRPHCLVEHAPRLRARAHEARAPARVEAAAAGRRERVVAVLLHRRLRVVEVLAREQLRARLRGPAPEEEELLVLVALVEEEERAEEGEEEDARNGAAGDDGGALGGAHGRALAAPDRRDHGVRCGHLPILRDDRRRREIRSTAGRRWRGC